MGDTRGVVRLGMPCNERPKPVDLQRFLTVYCGLWRSIGLNLGLELSVLNELKADNHTVRESFRVTLERWSELNVGVTWGNLELAITNTTRGNLGLQPLTTMPPTQSEVTVIQLTSCPRQNNDIRLEESANVILKQIICKRYKEIIEHMDPIRISQLLVDKRLLKANDFKAIEKAPTRYAKISVILEYLRFVNVPSLFIFCNELKEIPSQSRIGSSMLIDLELLEFPNISSPVQQRMNYACVESFTAEFEFIECNRFGDFHHCFLNFVDCLCAILQQIPDVFNTLIERCKELMACNCTYQVEIFPADYMRTLSQCGDVCVLLRMLAPYLSWYSHSILEPLVESCNCSKANDLVNKFDDWANEQYILNILEPCSSMIPDRGSNYTILTTVLNRDCPEHLRVEYVNDVLNDMANKFGIKKYSLHLLAIVKKPMILFWMISKSLVPVVTKQLTEDCKEYFKKKNWSEISIYPDTLFKIDDYIKVGSLTYLDRYSEKWDHDLKSQLVDIERLPDLMRAYRQDLDAVRKHEIENLLHEKLERQSNTIVELKESKESDCIKFKAQIEHLKKDNQCLEEQVHYLENEQHDLKEENQLLKAEIQKLRQTSEKALTRTQSIESNNQDSELITMDADKLMNSLKNSYRHQKFQLYKELSFCCCKPENLYSKATELVDLNEIFAPLEDSNSYHAERILLEGHSGIGKSKLCEAIRWTWAEGKVLECDKLVILLPLTNLDVQNITNTEGLINYIASCNQLTQVSANCLDSTDIQNLLTVIIDGFDKLSDTLQQKSFFRNIIERKALPNARVLVTARPYDLVSLHHLFDKVFKVIGFSSHSKKLYICDVFNGSPNQSKLENHLKHHPYIDALCNNPLYLSILCSSNTFPHTTTEIYTNIVKKVQHCLNEEYELAQPSKILEKLEKLAFYGIIYYSNKRMFTMGELLDVCRTDPTCYGLLQSTECHSTQEIDNLFQFSPTGMQDYFAARYLKSQSEDEIYNFLIKLFIECYKQSDLWIYYFGITNAKNVAVKEYLFPTTLNQEKKFVNRNIQDALKNPDFVLYLFKCVQEAQNDKMCARLVDYFEHDFVMTNCKLPHYEMTCLGYFLSKSNKNWNKLCLDGCAILDQGVCLLYDYLIHNSNITINTISICSNKLTPKSSPCITDIIKFCQTKCALLSHNKISLEAITGTVTTLKRLWLSDTGITAKAAKSLPELINCLTELYIDNNQLKDEGAVVISDAICKTKILKLLDISKNDIKIEGTKAIAGALITNKSLETLLIGYNEIGSIGSDAFANAIEQEILLKTLSFNGDKTVDYSSALRIINSVDKNDNICSLCFPDTISFNYQRILKSKVDEINAKPARYTPFLKIQFSEVY